MAPLFAAVIVLLSIGSLGEVLAGLVKKVKSLFSITSSATQNTTEHATQLK